MDVLKLIEELEDIIDESSTVPLTKKVMVHSEEILDILQQIRTRLPDEMQQASWIKEEKERIIGEAQREAISIENDTKEKVKVMIDEHPITEAAKERANEIIVSANADAREIRLGAFEYADELLMGTQEQIERLVGLIEENREELRK